LLSIGAAHCREIGNEPPASFHPTVAQPAGGSISYDDSGADNLHPRGPFGP
jgi:hypothetical protein